MAARPGASAGAPLRCRTLHDLSNTGVKGLPIVQPGEWIELAARKNERLIAVDAKQLRQQITRRRLTAQPLDQQQCPYVMRTENRKRHATFTRTAPFDRRLSAHAIH